MLQASSAIPIVLPKYLLSNLVVVALMALENVVYHVLSNCLQNMLSNAYTYELDVVGILYISILGSNMDRCH